MLNRAAGGQGDRQPKQGAERDLEVFSLQMVIQQITSENESLRKQLNHYKEDSEAYRYYFI